MECADANTLAALVANALTESERAAIAVHAGSCERCHALLETLIDEQGAEVGDGTRIGRYVIGERLGAGGMGVVYAAVDSELRRRVAVKVLRADSGGQIDTRGRDRLLREAQLLASLSHPNVVTVFDIGTHEGQLFLAMELVEGGSFGLWLRRAPRTPEEIIDRLIDAGRGLVAAHAAGVVHRDVKPDNILVGGDGRARVTDFGLARSGGAPIVDAAGGAAAATAGRDLTRTGALMGTPLYMAPEQMAQGAADARSDQWSFCATAYEALAGVRPFPIDDLEARTSAIAEGRLAVPVRGRTVPGWVVRIIARGLRARPDERWPSMNAVVDALQRGRKRRGRIVRSAIGVTAVAGVIAVAVVARGGARTEVLPPSDKPQLDPRPGCHCPLSPCTEAGACPSECAAVSYGLGAAVPGVSVEDRQEALCGASRDGDAILYLAGQRCSIDRLMLARRRGTSYESVDLTDKLDRSRVALYEGCCTLSHDGSSMILARPDRRGFVRVQLAGFDPLPIHDDGELSGLLSGDATALTLVWPVLSADERTLYYTINDRSNGPNDSGPLMGTYESLRADAHARFPPGRRLPGRARFYDYATGVSSDGLSLFMSSEYRTHVLVRASTDQPFGDPSDVALPATLPGWRAMPVEGCRRILMTRSPGGCHKEQIVWVEASP